MTVVARCNGTLLVQDGDRLGVVEQGGGWIPVAIFVAALLAVIPLAAGVAFLFVQWPLGAGLLAGSTLGIAAVLGLVRLRRRVRAAPPGAPWLVFDRGARTLVDGEGAVIAPLDQVAVERAWQAGSSSKALVARHRGGRIVIARGNPFGDSVDAFEHALRAVR
jgi:hypothetical protein